MEFDKTSLDKKQLKELKESLQQSIDNAENARVLAISQGNKRAEWSAQWVKNGLQKRLDSLKGAK
jgi:hypothetical protein